MQKSQHKLVCFYSVYTGYSRLETYKQLSYQFDIKFSIIIKYVIYQCKDLTQIHYLSNETVT